MMLERKIRKDKLRRQKSYNITHTPYINYSFEKGPLMDS